jgi:hypothetical protein
MFSNELDKLLILHLADLDEGAKRLELLQSKIGDELDKLARQWTDEKGWRTEDRNWNEDKDLSVAPAHWLSEEGLWSGWFSLWYGHGDSGECSAEHDYFWLTRLCAAGRGQLGFRFYQEEFGKTPWKKFLQRQASAFANTRFILDDEPSLFLPVKVDIESLSRGAEEEDFKEALTPIVEALDYIHSIIHRFDELRDDMKKEQAS